jgi:uncharacterized protein (TIGR00645 family)
MVEGRAEQGQAMTIDRMIGSLIFASRWLLLPFFLGLIAGLVALLFKFWKGLINLADGIMSEGDNDIMLAILSLVDTTLVASLLLIVIFSGYENFVARIGVDDAADKPSWMGKVGFGDLKLKLIGSIVSISAVELLKAFMTSQSLTPEQLQWKVTLHLTFVISGVLFAVMDYVSVIKRK